MSALKRMQDDNQTLWTQSVLGITSSSGFYWSLHMNKHKKSKSTIIAANNSGLISLSSAYIYAYPPPSRLERSLSYFSPHPLHLFCHCCCHGNPADTVTPFECWLMRNHFRSKPWVWDWAMSLPWNIHRTQCEKQAKKFTRCFDNKIILKCLTRVSSVFSVIWKPSLIWSLSFTWDKTLLENIW